MCIPVSATPQKQQADENVNEDVSSPPTQRRKTEESSELAVPIPSSPANPASQGDMFATSPPSRRQTGTVIFTY